MPSQKDALTSASAGNHSIPTLSPRVFDTHSPGATAIWIALASGSLVVIGTGYVYWVNYSRQKQRKREEDQTRKREAEQAQAEQQAQHRAIIKDREEYWQRKETNTKNHYEKLLQRAVLQAGHSPNGPSSEMMDRYKQEFAEKKRAEGVDELTLQYLDADLDDIHPFDSISMVGVPTRDHILTLAEERVHFIANRFAMEEEDWEGPAVGRHSIGSRSRPTTSAPSASYRPVPLSPTSLTQQGYQERQIGSSELLRHNTSGSHRLRDPLRWQGTSYSDDIELGGLPPASPVHSAPGRFSSTVPPIPARSASRSTMRTSTTAPRPEHNISLEHEQDHPTYLMNQWAPGDGSYSVDDTKNLKGSRQMDTATHQIARQARPPTLNSNFTRPTGFLPSVSGHLEDTPYHFQDFETNIAGDEFAAEAHRYYQSQQRNYQIQQQRTKSPTQGDIVAKMMEEERKQQEFMDRRRKESEDNERKRILEEEREWVEKGESLELRPSLNKGKERMT
jgi:hypothetical protein